MISPACRPASAPRRAVPLLWILFLWLSAPVARAQEPVDTSAVQLIRRIGLEESRVMDHASWLTDVHGPRLTGSPSLRQASEWVVERLTSWGLRNARLEPWGEFGRGWTLESFSLSTVSPVAAPLHAFPKAWSGSTRGAVTGDVVLFDAKSEADFSRFRGRLGGKIVLLEDARPVEEPFAPPAGRRDAENLLGLANAASPSAGDRNYPPSAYAALEFQRRLTEFLFQEKPLAILDRGYKGDYGTIFVSGAAIPAPAGSSWRTRPRPWSLDAPEVIPQATVAVEHYNRLVRQLRKGLPVKAEIELRARYNTDDPTEHNVVAEIPGTDPALRDEVVMVGAHLDSWHAGTGATDNASGSAVMMEAMRILQEVYRQTGRQPRRTIRIALWTGEEQGLYGSEGYVAQHFGTAEARTPEHAKFSAYYNLDNGTGRIRGVYLQGNPAVAPIFRAWLAPFADLGATTLTLANTGGTDHLSFDAVGLPGFQFIQDPVAYSTRTHHSNMDTYDHLIEDDLKQAATIIASFVYHTAQRDEQLPRKAAFDEPAGSR